jgi:molybdopterin converting factor small subunit
LGATEPRRLALHAAARAALGAEEGDTLMALTPPANTDMATMQALERFEERLGARIDGVQQQLGTRIDGVEQRLDARIDAVEERLGARIDAVEERLGARIDKVQERLGARIDKVQEQLRTHTWKVVVGTGVGLYLATAATVIGAMALPR